MNKAIIYGIHNCNTIKKTLDWFSKNKIPFEFHNYKKSGISKEKSMEWCQQVGWEILLNKKSATWRSLSSSAQNKITSESSATKLMIENTSIIKRPVIEMGNKILVGFTEIELSKIKNQKNET